MFATCEKPRFRSGEIDQIHRARWGNITREPSFKCCNKDQVAQHMYPVAYPQLDIVRNPSLPWIEGVPYQAMSSVLYHFQGYGTKFLFLKGSIRHSVFFGTNEWLPALETESLPNPNSKGVNLQWQPNMKWSPAPSLSISIKCQRPIDQLKQWLLWSITCGLRLPGPSAIFRRLLQYCHRHLHAWCWARGQGRYHLSEESTRQGTLVC